MCKIYTYAPTEYFGSNTFLIDCDGEYAIVDPSIEYLELTELCGIAQPEIKYVLLTHSHFDHFLFIDSYVEMGAEVVIGGQDAQGLSDSYLNCYSLFRGIDKGYSGNYIAADENTVLPLGRKEINVINTPGHTRGSVSYLLGDSLFVGDTVFDGGGYGRCDLPGGNFEALQSSISRIMCLPDNIRLYCGHGAATTVKDAKKYFR